MKSAAQKKHVFCEKPVDLTLERARACAEAVGTAGVVCMIGFQRRFDPTFSALKARVDAGEIGTPEMLVVTSRDPGAPPVEYIKHSGGIFKDMLIHDFDIFRWILDDEADTLHATGSCLSDPAIAEAGDIDSTAVTIRTKRGRLCQINTARRAAYGYDQRFEVLGSAGMLQAGNVRPTEVTAYSKTEVSSDVPEAFFLERYRAAYALEIAHFFDAVTQGKPVRTTVADGLKALELAEAATRSWREGPRSETRRGVVMTAAPVRIRSAWSAWGGSASATRRISRIACRARRSWPRAVRWRKSGRGRARTLPEPRLYDDYADLLADRDVDAVWLVTPSSLHAQQIIDALRAGKHVFCEKPLSLDLAECERVMARRALSAFAGDHRFHAALRSELPGRVRQDRSGRDRPAVSGALADLRQERSPTVSSCGSRRPRAGFFSIARVHDIDVARWLLGNPRAKRVFAAGAVAIARRACANSATSITASAICEFEDGKLAMFYASRTQAHGQRHADAK